MEGTVCSSVLHEQHWSPCLSADAPALSQLHSVLRKEVTQERPLNPQIPGIYLQSSLLVALTLISKRQENGFNSTLKRPLSCSKRQEQRKKAAPLSVVPTVRCLF